MEWMISNFQKGNFFIECHKKQTRNQTNHNGQLVELKIPLRANDLLKWIQPNCLKRGKPLATKSWWVIVLHLNGWESGAIFLDQSQSKVNLNWSYHRSLLTLIKISLTVHCQSEKLWEERNMVLVLFVLIFNLSQKHNENHEVGHQFLLASAQPWLSFPCSYRSALCAVLEKLSE